MKVLVGVVAVSMLVASLGAPSVMANKGLWLADNSVVPPGMVAYHLFIDGVNPVWGQNDRDNRKTMELSHDGLRLCLTNNWGNKTYVCHKITVTPSAFNATYDAGFFLIPTSVNQSQLGVDLDTKYQKVGVGVGLNGKTSHIDMDMLYQDVSTVRYCIEDHHLKPGTDKFHECFEMAG